MIDLVIYIYRVHIPYMMSITVNEGKWIEVLKVRFY